MRPAIAALAAVLLLALAGCTALAPAAPPAIPAGEPTDAELAFEKVSSEAGFEYASIEGGAGNGNDGVYVADYDRDLREDVLVLGGEEPVLFENVGGRFEPSGALPELTDPDAGRIQSALWLDHDADGWEDLLLLRREAPPLFLENDGGAFERRDVGIEASFPNPVAATAADYDGDGCLDLFVANYGRWDETTPAGWNSAHVDVDNGYPNALYRGDCGDGFTRVDDAGVGPGPGGPHWSMAASFADVDGDGDPDVHVANDYHNDTLYRNRGDGTFSREVLGAPTDRNGMSSEVADLVGDAGPEVFVTNIFFPRERVGELPETDRRLFSNFLANRLGKRLAGNTLLVPDGGAFEDVGGDVGLAEGGWGWAAVAVDLDNDGERDVLHGTQDVVRFDRAEPVYSRPMAWVQDDGEFYRQDGAAVGLGVSDDRGVARLDYDVDGAVDVGIATYDEPYLLYRNVGADGDSLQVVVDGDGGNAVGAVVEATVGGRTTHHYRTARADYQSQDSRVVHVGLGDADGVDELSVRWPDGRELVLEDVAAGQRVRVTPDGIADRLAYGDGSDG